MAGFYPDVPAPRIPFDRNGTIGFDLNDSNGIAQLSIGQMKALNNETNSYALQYSKRGGYIGFIFPEPYDIVGHFITGHVSSGWSWRSLQTSVDTTNGMDGSWVTQAASYALSNPAPVPSYRTNISAVSWNGIKAVRHGMSHDGWDWGAWKNFHLYGAPSSFTGADTLRIWHPTLDEPLDDPTAADGAYLDWGDIARGTSADRTFRIKNNSTTLTANAITISSEVFTNTTPAIESQMLYSDGGAFATTISIGNVAPNSLSSVITARRATDLSATLGLWTGRTTVEAGSWS